MPRPDPRRWPLPARPALSSPKPPIVRRPIQPGTTTNQVATINHIPIVDISPTPKEVPKPRLCVRRAAKHLDRSTRNTVVVGASARSAFMGHARERRMPIGRHVLGPGRSEFPRLTTPETDWPLRIEVDESVDDPRRKLTFMIRIPSIRRLISANASASEHRSCSRTMPIARSSRGENSEPIVSKASQLTDGRRCRSPSTMSSGRVRIGSAFRWATEPSGVL